MRNPEDVACGLVIRELRLAKGLTQTELGEGVGMSYQQIQKYESGANRVAISTLFGIADQLGMKPSELVLKIEGVLAGST